jgi:hypothetical protein
MELQYYGKIICNFLQKVLAKNSSKNKNPKFNYSIISLNYDLILETITDFLDPFKHPGEKNIGFTRQHNNNNNYTSYLAKLHGSVDNPGTIIPPTWNKSINKNIFNTWKLAYKILNEANYIRILGYSLPITDNYIKYLLKTSIIQSNHLDKLKRIDVLCKDDKYNTIKSRYDNFIKLDYYYFKNADVEKYFEKLKPTEIDPYSYSWSELERVHENFFEKD